MKRHTLLPPPWVRTDDRTRGKTSARYSHPAGWRIEHCGHPTALWPYALINPAGELVLAPNGRAFRTLADAGAHVQTALWTAGGRA